MFQPHPALFKKFKLPMKMPQNPLSPKHPWSRDDLTAILQTALRVQEYRFARRIALIWLASYPGDLPVKLMYGQALLGEGRVQQAKKTARELIDRDPEYLEARELLARTSAGAGFGDDPAILGSILALGGEALTPRAKALPKTLAWVSPLRDARRALAAKDLPRAEDHIQQALLIDPDTPLTALTHLRVLAAREDTPPAALQSLATHFHQRWPDCVQFILLLAEALLKGSDANQGVALLHQAAANDVTGQVARRLWGDAHPYSNLWPTRFAAVIEIPIPARVAAALGWNLLSGGEQPEMDSDQPQSERAVAFHPISKFQPSALPRKAIHSPKSPIPETLRSVQDALEKVGDHLNQSAVARADGRFPIYVILSVRRGLQEKYGRKGAVMLASAMETLAATMRRQPDWGALVFFADDPADAAKHGLKPVAPDDPWAIKLALTDLDAALGKRGMMIGALLIVGGPQVVPFHTLPNPTDDLDMDVPSDNPYATRDENYFIPEWPVGRLPGGAGDDPSLLLDALQAIAASHTPQTPRRTAWWRRLANWLGGLFHSNRKVDLPGFGFSAEVWRKASMAVYRPMDATAPLQTSPPVDVERSQPPTLRGKLGYFNLHGLADTAEWYGQRDPLNGSGGPDYPVALRVQDIRNGGQAPEIVFSEACYGAHILDKTAENSLALRFLAAGSRAVIGSTVMSYGSIGTPLNAADLLGASFWKFVQEGSPAGEALKRAKIALARTMHRRQGYLDGEDQKTLISFVLYGDPLGRVSGANGVPAKQRKAVLRPVEPPSQVKTVCDRGSGLEPISPDVMLHVKQVVKQYLPGMQGAQAHISHEHLDCDCEDHCCPTAQLGSKARPEHPPERRVVTLSKSIPGKRHTHPVYARLTLDKQGKVVKLAVSR